MGIISFDEALVLYVGQFGRGQRVTVACASLFGIPNALAFLLFIFLSVDPISSHQWQCTDSNDQACAAVFNSPMISSQDFCQLAPDQWHFTSLTGSLVAQYALVCGEAWKVHIANLALFLGCFIGSGVFGLLADKVGRRAPLFLATAVVAASTLLSLTAKSYWGYAVTRAVTGFGAAGQSQCAFLMAAEVCGPAFRAVANMGVMVAFTFGEFILAGLAYVLPNCHHLIIVVGVINAAALLLWPVMPESARWLLSQGRAEEASALLRKLSDANGSHMPQQTLVAGQHNSKASNSGINSNTTSAAASADEAGDLANAGSQSASSQNLAVTMLQLLRNPELFARSLVLATAWFSIMLTYYAVSLGSGGLPGSLSVTVALQAVAELLAVLAAAALVDKAGRHCSASLGLLVAGGSCLGSVACTAYAAMAVLAAIGKFGATVALAVMAVYTQELFPTCVRSTAMGVFNQASRCGSIAAPFLLMAGANMGTSSSSIIAPFTACAALSLFVGLLMLTQPETLGLPMAESLEDMSALQSVFAAKPWRQGCLPLLAFVFRARAHNARELVTTMDANAADPRCRSSSQGAAESITIICQELDLLQPDMQGGDDSTKAVTITSLTDAGWKVDCCSNCKTDQDFTLPRLETATAAAAAVAVVNSSNAQS